MTYHPVDDRYRRMRLLEDGVAAARNPDVAAEELLVIDGFAVESGINLRAKALGA